MYLDTKNRYIGLLLKNIFKFQIVMSMSNFGQYCIKIILLKAHIVSFFHKELSD
jgi:hypothetical protein